MKSDIGVSKTEIGHGQIGIRSKRLVKRANRFNPDKRVDVGETLVVERLRLGRRSRNFLVDRSDAAAQGYRSIENFTRHRSAGMRGVAGILCASARRNGSH